MTDTYAVEMILQDTRRAKDGLVWKETNSGGYTATIRCGSKSIQLRLYHGHCNTGMHIFLSFTMEQHGTIDIAEPKYIGWFEKKDETGQKHKLALLLGQLYAAVSKQCSERRKYEEQTFEERKQGIYSLLLSGGRS